MVVSPFGFLEMEVEGVFRRHCQVDEQLVDRPPRCWAPTRREPAMLGIKDSFGGHLRDALRRVSDPGLVREDHPAGTASLQAATDTPPPPSIEPRVGPWGPNVRGGGAARRASGVAVEPVSCGVMDSVPPCGGSAGRRRPSTFALGGATGKGNVRRRRDGDVQAYSLPLNLFLCLHLSSSSAPSVSPRQYRSSISSISSSLSPK